MAIKYFVAIYSPDSRTIALLEAPREFEHEPFTAAAYDSKEDAERAAEENSAACAFGYSVFEVDL